MNNDFKKIKNPESIKENLKIASLYLTVFELLKSCIVDSVLGFHSFDFGENFKPVRSKDYKNIIKKLNNQYGAKEISNKDEFRGACYWFRDLRAISDKEVTELIKIREQRNKIAHELASILIDDDVDIDLKLFSRIKYYIEKIDVWWFKNIEMDIWPDREEYQNINPNEIKTGRMLLMDYLIKNIL